MNSYQRLKMRLVETETKLIETQRIVDMFKNAITIVEKTDTPTIEPKSNENSIDFAIRQTIAVAQNRTNELVKRELTNWVINNIDKETIKRWLKNGKE